MSTNVTQKDYDDLFVEFQNLDYEYRVLKKLTNNILKKLQAVKCDRSHLEFLIENELYDSLDDLIENDHITVKTEYLRNDTVIDKEKILTMEHNM